MRLFVFTCLLLAQGHVAFSQGAPDFLAQEFDTLQQKAKPTWNLFISPYLQWNEVFERPMAYGGADVELVYKQRVAVGIYAETMLGTFIKRVVFPNTYELTNHKYGVMAGYYHPITEKLKVSGLLKFSRQYVRWQEIEGERFTLADYCYEIRPQVGVSYSVLKNLYFGGRLAYNFTHGLDMSGIDNGDMDGWVYAIVIGFRIWNK